MALIKDDVDDDDDDADDPSRWVQGRDDDGTCICFFISSI